MSANWTFTFKAKNEKTRNPVSGEFFASDAIKNAGEALIREAIQNSLDARPDRPNGQAQVRIYVSGAAKALPPAAHQKWFGSAWSHYLAPKNGLRPGKATRDKKCGFLVFEDFGTTGLIGDWEQTDVIEGAKNAFFYFFRAEGATEKSADQLGRWGIGKQVFPRSSHAQTLFGYSVTKEHPNGFLMGSCILKYHEVDRKVYRPDGYFSKPIKLEGGDQISGPITDESLLADFRGDFNLSRKNGQPGLSVVVPWLDEGEEGSSGFDQDSLLIAILDGYYLPILEGKLEVALEDEDGVIRIKADNFHKILSDLAARLKADDRRQKLLNRTRALVRLAQSMMESTPVTYVLPDCDATKAVWTEGMLPEELGKSIRTSLAEGRLVQVKAALTVRRKDKPDVRDEFSCFMIKDEAFNDRPCHIREDLIISNVTSSRANGFATIVRIDKGALANLLGTPRILPTPSGSLPPRTLRTSMSTAGWSLSSSPILRRNCFAVFTPVPTKSTRISCAPTSMILALRPLMWKSRHVRSRRRLMISRVLFLLFLQTFLSYRLRRRCASCRLPTDSRPWPRVGRWIPVPM